MRYEMKLQGLYIYLYYIKSVESDPANVLFRVSSEYLSFLYKMKLQVLYIYLY